MSEYQIPAEVLDEVTLVLIEECENSEVSDDSDFTVLCVDEEDHRATAERIAPLIAAAAYRAGQQQAARDIAERINLAPTVTPIADQSYRTGLGRAIDIARGYGEEVGRG